MRTLPIFLLACSIPLSTAAQAPPPPTPVPAVPPPAITHPVTYVCSGTKKKNADVLLPRTTFTPTSAGWDLSTVPRVVKGVCSSAITGQPFYFSIPVPPGNYRVTMTLGGRDDATVTVRAEARRLYIEQLPIAAGKKATRSIDVNVRVPEFLKPDGTLGRVRLKQREIGNLDWDAKLTLEFNGTHPAFRSLTIEPITEPVIYLAGDSTMVDQDVEPWASWGQQFPRFFSPGVVIANHAESGESAISFLGEQRFAEIMSLIRPGDYFFVQFAHNDQKVPNGLARYIQIMTDFVTQVRDKGATPVIVTSMNRDSFDAEGHITDTLGGYPQASRQIAKDTGVALIDLNDMSKTMFEAMGSAGADHAFMKFTAGSYPGVQRDIADTTHFNNYGAYELARCVVHGIRAEKLPITKYLDPSVPDFDPAHPDAFADFHLPYTPPQVKGAVTRHRGRNLK